MSTLKLHVCETHPCMPLVPSHVFSGRSCGRWKVPGGMGMMIGTFAWL